MKSFPVSLRSALAAAALALVSAAPTLAADETPTISNDAAVQKDLAELDRALNTNAKLEEALRLNLDKLSEQSFRVQNPDVDALLKKLPGLEKALTVDRHFLLRRAIARLVSVKVARPDALALDKFLREHPDIQRPLERNPRLIMDTKFHLDHPQLARFLEAHPVLSTLLLEQQQKKAAKKKQQ